MDETEIQAAQLGFNYDLAYTGEQLDEAITKVLNGYIYPEGTIEITDTTETDVSAYATAVISDDNLKGDNILQGVTILGIEGTATAAAQGEELTVSSFAGDTAQVYEGSYSSVTVNPIPYSETANSYGTTVTIG